MNRTAMRFFIVSSLIQSFFMSNVIASNVEELILKECKKRPDLCDKKKSRFSTYQPNYAIFQSTEDDERSIEAHYSFQYKITKPHCVNINKDTNEATTDLNCLLNYKKRGELFFSYTGEFDFYLGTRESGPVINRISNPAFHYRKHFDNTKSIKSHSFEWFNVGIEHRSNGQVVNADDVINDPRSLDFGKYRAQVEFEKDNYEYFDYY